MRRQMPHAQKIKHHVRYIRQWPYIVLAGPGNAKIVPTISKDSVIKNILGKSPLIDMKEPTGPVNWQTYSHLTMNYGYLTYRVWY